MSFTKTLVGSVVVVAMLAAWAAAGVHSEGFDTGYTLGSTVGAHADWYDGGGGPVVTSGIGVASSVGLAQANNIFVWTANPFDWNDAAFPGTVVFQMQVLPGMENRLVWRFDEAGSYDVRSTEYSGPRHSEMYIPDAIRVTQ